MLFPISNTRLNQLENELIADKNVRLSVLRLDEIHPVVSGNKLFKLHYFLEDVKKKSLEGIISFGGAYSNHLVATAVACNQIGKKSIGIVRGEKPLVLSHTLQHCVEFGMELIFVSRQQYGRKEAPGFLKEAGIKYKDHLIVPEGGYYPLGAAGASMIMDLVAPEFTHICCAAGTATTVAGLLMGAKNNQQIIALPVLRNLADFPERLAFLTNDNFNAQRLLVAGEYHFGGYAKKTGELIEFMNYLFDTWQLPTDFVYTGKMMFGVIDMVKNGRFSKGSNILCLHTGGLQGNLSLSPGTLVF